MEQFKKITNFIEKNKRNSIIISSIILAITIIGTMYAYFSDIARATPSIKTGVVSVKLVEDAPFNDLSSIPTEGATTDTKTFRAVSDGTIDAYVRAKIIPIVEYFDTEEDAWIVANIPTSDIDIEIIATNWIESEGYYYYKNILSARDKSEDVIVKITNINIPDNLRTEKIRATIKVVLESAQCDYDAWKSIFNIAE